MYRKTSLSGKNLTLIEITGYYNDSVASFRLYFSTRSPAYLTRFSTYTPKEVQDELTIRIDELDRSATFNIMASLEASFYIDYLIRCGKRKKDALSKRLRPIYIQKGDRISLEKELLKIWRQEHPEFKSLISSYIGALKHRHWLAHGRYRTDKSGQKYEYYSMHLLAQSIVNQLNLETD